MHRRKIFVFSILPGVACFAFAKLALAMPQPVRFCAQYKANFTDSALGLPLAQRDDYYWSNSNKTARGVKLRIDPNAAGVATIERWTDWTGPNAGCATVLLDDDWTYDVKILSRTNIDNVYVEVNSTGSTAWSSLALDDWTPVAGVKNIETVNAHRAWNMTAAMSWALYRRRWNVSGETFIAHTDDISPCPGAAACQSGGEMWFNPAASQIGYRYVMVHELGHLLARKLDANTSSSKNYNASTTTCGPAAGHQMTTKEHSSAAAVEGFAHYYAAVAFNNTSQSDCAFMYNKAQDFDKTAGMGFDFFAPGSISCEGSPVWNLAVVDARDYLGDMCSGTLSHRANELDFLRFFWDLDTDEGLSFGEIANLLDRANPRNWNAVGSNGSPNNPWDRIVSAAAITGNLVAVLNQASNGVDR